MPDSDWGAKPLWTYYRERWAFFQTDHPGTPWMLIDNCKRVAWEGRLKAFGEVEVLGTPLVRNLVRFPGQIEDGETEGHYNYFRHYDPATGRYITSDPIGLDGVLNTYVVLCVRFVHPPLFAKAAAENACPALRDTQPSIGGGLVKPYELQPEVPPPVIVKKTSASSSVRQKAAFLLTPTLEH